MAGTRKENGWSGNLLDLKRIYWRFNDEKLSGNDVKICEKIEGKKSRVKIHHDFWGENEQTFSNIYFVLSVTQFPAESAADNICNMEVPLVFD